MYTLYIMIESDTLLCSSLVIIASIVRLGIYVAATHICTNVFIFLFVSKSIVPTQHSTSVLPFFFPMHHKHYTNVLVFKKGPWICTFLSFCIKYKS